MTTTSLVTLADAIKDLLIANQTGLGLRTIYYGEDVQTPDFPSAEVTSDVKERDFATLHQFDLNPMRVMVTLYFGKLQMPEINTREADLLAEAVEAVLHADKTLGGLVIFGYVERMQSGIVRTPRGLFLKGTRLTWRGRSREVF